MRGEAPFDQDYQALTQAAGFAPLRDWTTIEIRGADRQTLLQNLCTNDLRALSAGQGCEAFLADVKGKIVAHVLVLIEAERILFLTVPNQAVTIIAHLEKYIIREDVQLVDLSGSTAWLIISPLAAVQHFQEACHELSGQGTSPWQHVGVKLEQIAAQCGKCDWLWCDTFLLRCDARDFELVSQMLTDAGARKCCETVGAGTADAITALRIESGFPLYGVDFDSSNLPQEIDRNEQAISFQKGCYLGQETIARIDALGHVNQKLVPVKLNEQSEALPSPELSSEGKIVGRVTSCSWSPYYGAIAGLALVRRGFNDPGTQLECGSAAAEIATRH